MDLLKVALIGGAASYTLATLLPSVLPAEFKASAYKYSATLFAVGILGGYGLYRAGQREAGLVTAGVVSGIGLLGGVSEYMRRNTAAPAAPAPAALGAVELGNTWQLGAVELGNTWQLGAVELGAPDWGYESMNRTAEGRDWGYGEPFSLGAIEAQMMDSEMGY